MQQQARIQAQVFQTFDGHTDAATFFEHIRERAFAGKSYPPSTLDGTLATLEDEEPDISEVTLAENTKFYATLFSEISRSLTGAALIVKRQIDIATEKSGFRLLEALKLSSGTNARVSSDSKLAAFLDSTMENQKYHILQHWIEKFTADFLEIEALNEPISDSIKLATFRKSITFSDARYNQYLVHTFTSRFGWHQSIEYFRSVAELLIYPETTSNKKNSKQSPVGAAMYASRNKKKMQLHSRPANRTHVPGMCSYCKEPHNRRDCPKGLLLAESFQKQADAGQKVEGCTRCGNTNHLRDACKFITDATANVAAGTSNSNSSSEYGFALSAIAITQPVSTKFTPYQSQIDYQINNYHKHRTHNTHRPPPDYSLFIPHTPPPGHENMYHSNATTWVTIFDHFSFEKSSKLDINLISNAILMLTQDILQLIHIFSGHRRTHTEAFGDCAIDADSTLLSNIQHIAFESIPKIIHELTSVRSENRSLNDTIIRLQDQIDYLRRECRALTAQVQEHHREAAPQGLAYSATLHDRISAELFGRSDSESSEGRRPSQRREPLPSSHEHPPPTPFAPRLKIHAPAQPTVKDEPSSEPRVKIIKSRPPVKVEPSSEPRVKISKSKSKRKSRTHSPRQEDQLDFTLDADELRIMENDELTKRLWPEVCASTIQSSQHSCAYRAQSNISPRYGPYQDHFQKLIIDSGASHHMTPHKQNLINFHPDNTGAIIQGINENTMPCEGTGDLPVQFINNKNQIEKVIIRNVWYVPNIQHVLISVAQIIKQGHHVFFTASPYIKTHNFRKIPIHLHNGIYTIDNIPSNSKTWTSFHPNNAFVATTPTTFASSITNREINHLRLAHIHDKSVLATITASTGLLPITPETPSREFCSSCAKTKIKHKAMPHKPSTHKDRTPLHTMSTDYWGPFTVITANSTKKQKRYLHGFKCLTTQYAIVFIDRNKKDTSENLLTVQNIANRLHMERLHQQFINKGIEYKPVGVHVIQGDYENLFSGGTFTSFASSIGIDTRFSAPYNHAQNGSIENFWYQITVLTSVQLSYADINPNTSFLWEFALRNAVRIWNNTVHTSQTENKSPYELVTGKIPDFTLDRVWGCPVYYLLDPTPKLGERGAYGINLGLNTSTKDAYYIFDPKINKIIVRRDVHFDEGWKTRINSEPSVFDSYKQHETTPSMDQSTDHTAKTESNQIKTESTEDFPPSHMLNQLHLNDALQPSDSDTESDLDANETEITPDNDQFGYNHIIAQVSDDQFLVTWPDTYNITQEAYDARLNTEPVPYTSSWVHQRANGNLNAGWHDTIEPRDALDSTHIETFISSNPINNPSSETSDALYAFVDIPDPVIAHALTASITNTNSNSTPDIEIITPIRYKDVLNSLQKQDWLRAMDREIEGLTSANTWELVPLTQADNVITGKWVFKIKYKNGQLLKYKARWCARGFSQKYGVDYDEVFSPVARGSSIKTILALATQENEHIYCIDVQNAFVQAQVKGYDIYLEQPHGQERFASDGTKLVCKLNKYLYGLLQASREFNMKLTNVLINEFKFKQSDADTCIFLLPDQPNQHRIRLSVYVDDIVLTCRDQPTIDSFITKLKTIFPITVEKLTQILGIQIQYDKIKGILQMNQEFAITQAIKTFRLESEQIASTPMEYNWHPDLHTENKTITNNYPIRETLGTLSHFANHTRPDIAFAVARLQREMHKPTHSVVIAIKRIFRYLAGTPTLSITYNRNPQEIINSTQIITGFADATWGAWESDIETTLRSTSGHIHKLCNGPVAWGSTLQRGRPAQSSAEAEYIAAYHCATTTLYLKNLLEDLGIKSSQEPITIYDDSDACIGMSKNPVNHKNNKHIMLKYHWVRQLTFEGIICLKKIDTTNNIADILTKAPRTVHLFQHLRNLLFNTHHT
jgi:hypothetical protein